MQSSHQVEEEKKGHSQKHFNLKEDKDKGVEEVELIQNKHTRNIASPFINQSKSWDDPELAIPEDIKRNIIEELGFQKPSRIQANAIPLIIGKDKEYEHLIAQSKNGTGKTGAFSVGSILRVDRKLLKPQVLVLAHVRELSQQIADVYCALTKGTDIQVSNFTVTGKSEGCQIVVSTIGKI